MDLKIYIASKTCHADKWRALRDAGAPFISTWIDEAGEGETADYADLAERCINEAANCDALILYSEPHEILKGAWLEAGAALAMGAVVVSVGTCANWSTTFAQHPGWAHAETVEKAIESITVIADLLAS
jgi:hypothetical protein